MSGQSAAGALGFPTALHEESFLRSQLHGLEPPPEAVAGLPATTYTYLHHLTEPLVPKA